MSLRKINMILAALWGRIGDKIADVPYLAVRYRLIFGKKLDFENPVGFNEKINWLKVNNRNPLYSKLVDKAEVKGYVEEIIGKDYIIPTYGVWDNFDDIDFESLPDQFVLKSTNGGGGTGVVICRDKSLFDISAAKAKLLKSCNTNWMIGREWVYYDVKPRFIAEKLMKNDDGTDLVDYKIFCFNGVPKILFLASDRYTIGEPLKFDWYDIDLNHLPFKSKGYPNANRQFPEFPEFEEMKAVAAKLSSGMPFVRVDLYLINHHIYFGEYTFFHDAGFVPLEPWEWELEMGDLIDINSLKCD